MYSLVLNKDVIVSSCKSSVNIHKEDDVPYYGSISDNEFTSVTRITNLAMKTRNNKLQF